MPSFLPKAFRTQQAYPACVDLDVLFSDVRSPAIVGRVTGYLQNVHAMCSDNSFERTGRPGIITEVFSVAMPSIDAYISEIELCNAMHDQALGKINDESVKVYLQKYLETHTFVYQQDQEKVWRQTIKSGASKKTGNEVPLFYLNYGEGNAFVVNDVQKWLLPRILNNAEYSVRSL